MSHIRQMLLNNNITHSTVIQVNLTKPVNCIDHTLHSKTLWELKLYQGRNLANSASKAVAQKESPVFTQIKMMIYRQV